MPKFRRFKNSFSYFWYSRCTQRHARKFRSENRASLRWLRCPDCDFRTHRISQIHLTGHCVSLSTDRASTIFSLARTQANGTPKCHYTNSILPSVVYFRWWLPPPRFLLCLGSYKIYSMCLQVTRSQGLCIKMEHKLASNRAWYTSCTSKEAPGASRANEEAEHLVSHQGFCWQGHQSPQCPCQHKRAHMWIATEGWRLWKFLPLGRGVLSSSSAIGYDAVQMLCYMLHLLGYGHFRLDYTMHCNLDYENAISHYVLSVSIACLQKFRATLRAWGSCKASLERHIIPYPEVCL